MRSKNLGIRSSSTLQMCSPIRSTRSTTNADTPLLSEPIFTSVTSLTFPTASRKQGQIASAYMINNCDEYDWVYLCMVKQDGRWIPEVEYGFKYNAIFSDVPISWGTLMVSHANYNSVRIWQTSWKPFDIRLSSKSCQFLIEGVCVYYVF